MNKKLTLTGANILFFIFTIAFLAYQIIAVILFGQAFTDNLYLVIIINQLMIASFVLVYCIVKRINLRETFKFNKLGIVPALLIVVISVPAIYVATMLNNIVVYLLLFIGDIPAQNLPVPQNLQELLVGIGLIGVLPGVCEELMHRGFLLKAYEKRGSYKAVVIVSILFGLFHFDITNLLGPIFLGLIIGYYVVRTNSIFAGMLAHFMNNMIAQLMQCFFADSAPAAELITLTSEELTSLIIVGVIALIITSGLLILFREATKGKSVILQPISKPRQDVRAVLSHWPVIAVLVLHFLNTVLSVFSFAMLRITGI